MKNKDEPASFEKLYSTPTEISGGTRSDLSQSFNGAPVASGSSSPGERDFYRSRTLFFKVGAWAVPIFLGCALAVWAVYVQSIDGPVNQLQVKADQDAKDIQGLKDDLKALSTKYEQLKLQAAKR